MDSTDKLQIRIAPSQGWLRVDWLQIWHYRDLLVLLVRRDFFSRYAQSALGPLWFVIQPLLTTLVFTVVFGQIAQISTGGVPPMLFYLCNQLGWLYFSGSFIAVSGTFLSNQHLFSKVYFPRLVVPLANLLSNLVPVVIQLLSFLAFWCWFYFSADAPVFHFTAWALISPVAFLHLAVLALGFGLCMAALTAKYRDLAQLTGILIQLWMYASPVIFPLAGVPSKWRWIFEINPVTLPLELLRLGLLGSGTIELSLVLFSCAGTLVVVVAGLSLFSQVERDFVDVI